jgi:hypothetical protein
MRIALFIAAGIAVAMSGSALAASPTAAGGSMQSASPNSQTAAPPATSSSPDASSNSSAAPAGGAAADTSATASSSAAAALSVGEPVKDNTGATIGAISGLNTGSNGQQMAVIKMGNDTFQVPTTGLGVADGAATINMSQAQITSKLHPAAGGR